MAPDSEILGIIRVTWKVADASKLARAHGMKILRLTLLDLTNVDPNNVRNPSGFFIARMHQVIAHKAEVASAGPVYGQPSDMRGQSTTTTTMPASDPAVDLGELWTLAIQKLPLLSATKSRFLGYEDLPPSYKLVGFSHDGIATVEIDWPFNLQVFDRIQGHVARALEQAMAEINVGTFRGEVQIPPRLKTQ